MKKSWPNYDFHIKTSLTLEEGESAISIYVFTEKELDSWVKKQSAFVRKYVASAQFLGKEGEVLLVPDKEGEIAQVLFGVGEEEESDLFWTYGKLPQFLPKDYTYRIENSTHLNVADIAYVWSLSCYNFMRHNNRPGHSREQLPSLLVEEDELDKVKPFLQATYWVRDMINYPPNKLTPKALAHEADHLRTVYGACLDTIVGDDLITCNYPSVYVVGKASSHEPRVIDLRWGEGNFPKIAIVGKGITFDTGGLNLKSSNGMKEMRKDMGGAAHALGLAAIIMEMKLPVQIRVLIGAAENAVSGSAFRPSDVIKTRQGIEIEVGDTDAEGRVLLCDLLHEAGEERPDLLIDFATLTGSARVALGTDLPAIFSNRNELARELQDISLSCHDPMWHMPLWKKYKADLRSNIASVCTISKSPYGDAINAAIFLDMFVPKEVPWLHIDFMGWNNSSRPGRPEGGEATGLRAMMRLISKELGLALDL